MAETFVQELTFGRHTVGVGTEGTTGKQRRYITVGAVSGGLTPPNLLISTNLSIQYYYLDNLMFSERAKLRSWGSGPTSSNPLPLANRTSDYWPSSLPAGDTYFVLDVTPPEVAGQQYAVTFPAGTITSMVTHNNMTVNNFNSGAGTALITPTINQPTGGIGCGVRITISGAFTSLSIKPVGDNSTAAANFAQNISDMTAASGVIRTMDLTGVNNLAYGGGAYGGGTYGAPNYYWTSTNRVKPTSGDWDGNNGPVGHGPSFEDRAALCDAVGRKFWETIPWNSAPSYIDAIGDQIAIRALAGKTTYIEVHNEVWNSGFPIYGYARSEAYYSGIPRLAVTSGGLTRFSFTGSISGTTLTVTAITGTPFSGVAGFPIDIGGNGISQDTKVTAILTGTGGVGTYTVNNSQTVSSATLYSWPGGAVERLCERTIEVMTRITARIAAAEVANSRPNNSLQPFCIRVLAHQNSTYSWISDMLDYVGFGADPCRNHVDIIATAPYFGAQGTIPTNTTNLQTIADGCYTEIDQVVGFALNAKTVAAGKTNDRGNAIGYACYEGGNHVLLSDIPTRHAWGRDSRIYEVYMYYLDQLDHYLGAIQFCHYHLCSSVSGNAGNQSDWGALEQSQEHYNTANRYKAKALHDFAVGYKQLQPFVGLPSGASTSVNNGDILATVSRRTWGSTLAIVGTTALSITDNGLTFQIKVADKTQFTNGATISGAVRETHASAINGPYRDNAISFPVTNATTLDTAFNATGHFVYSGGQLVATHTAGTDDVARSTTSHGPTQAGVFDFTFVPSGAGAPEIGFGNNTITNNSNGIGNKAGGCGWDKNLGTVRINSVVKASPGTFALTDTIIGRYISDGVSGYIHFKLNGSWVVGDGTTMNTGVDVTALGAVFAMVYNFGATVDTFTFPSW